MDQNDINSEKKNVQLLLLNQTYKMMTILGERYAAEG